MQLLIARTEFFRTLLVIQHVINQGLWHMSEMVLRVTAEQLGIGLVGR